MEAEPTQTGGEFRRRPRRANGGFGVIGCGIEQAASRPHSAIPGDKWRDGTAAADGWLLATALDGRQQAALRASVAHHSSLGNWLVVPHAGPSPVPALVRFSVFIS